MTVNGTSKGLPALLQDKTLQKQVLGGIGLLTGLGAGLASYAILQEPFNVILERLTIRIPHAKGRLPSAGLRILHLSDTHFQGIDWRERAKIDSIRRLTAKLEYDLLIHTGDFWHNETGLENITRLLASITPPRLGSYGVFGNHDYVCYSHSEMLSRSWERYQLREGHSRHGHQTHGLVALYENMRELYRFAHYFMNMPFDLKRVRFNDIDQLKLALAERNMQVLHNQAIHLRHKPGQSDGVDLYLAGIDDLAEGTPDLQAALGAIDDAEPNLLLSHNPDVLEESISRRANLILAGHTHGGQIVLPWLGAAHTHSEHLRRHEAAGYMWRDQTQVYVSRGIGEGIPLRFGARPQIALITVLPDGK